MTRLLAALLLTVPPAAGLFAQETTQERAQELTRQATDLANAKQYDEALQLLMEAQAAAPDYAPAQEWLAYVYEVTGRKTEALKHLAVLLALQPRSETGAQAARRLFFNPPFPRVLTRATLAVSPVRFTVDQGCALGPQSVPGFPERFALCYTTSPKYPEDGTEGGPLVERALPGGGAAAQFNRVVYGYREAPETGEFRLRVVAYYPSCLLSGSQTDLGPTAQTLVHLMLRFQSYAEGYLGLAPQGDAEGINRLYLCTGGPRGAERDGADLLLYRVLSDPRAPQEWFRQLAHECGHLLLPPVGGFQAPEAWGSGEVGERLFLYWLVNEAARFARTDWPSAQAVERLDGLWPGCGAPIEDYLAAAGRAPLGVWAAAGPESELIMGMDQRAMQYYTGFVLHVLAAHGTAGLRDVIRTCAGTTVADMVYAYRQACGAWAKAGPIILNAGGYSPAASRLTQPPPPADLTPAALLLAAGDSVTYPVFLPAATWRLAPTVRETGVRLLVSFDGSPDAQVEIQPTTEPSLIGPLAEGWHKVVLRAPPGQAALHLEGLTFSQGPVP